MSGDLVTFDLSFGPYQSYNLKGRDSGIYVEEIDGAWAIKQLYEDLPFDYLLTSPYEVIPNEKGVVLEVQRVPLTYYANVFRERVYKIDTVNPFDELKHFDLHADKSVTYRFYARVLTSRGAFWARADILREV